MSAHDTADDTATGIIAWLRSHGADQLGHGGGRTLLDHLVGTYAVVRAWNQSAWLQYAALLHSVYGTDAYHHQLVPVSARVEVAALAGERAERLAYLFGVIPRGPLLPGAHRSSGTSTDSAVDGDPPTSDELDALVLLHMANLADQAQASDGSPGRWLVRLGQLAELFGGGAIEAPLFMWRLAALSEAEESLARDTYRDAVSRSEGTEARANRFGLVAAVCPVVAEPCVWLSYLGVVRGDAGASRSWAVCARRRFSELGTPWDKRLTLPEWEAILAALETPGTDPLPGSIADPRALFDALVGTAASGRTSPRATPPNQATGRQRFQRYVEAFADSRDAKVVYPDLPSQPWHDPNQFPLVGYLEANYPAIRHEILALDGADFHRESERIGRTGNWDVAFLYERGRRHDDVCAACPVTTRAVESHPTVRTGLGLIYVSRMRAGTHIEAHRGPTNLRVRCHLGVQVPDGDCAIRVGVQTRRWQDGQCLVFDDFFEHEAWNHTREDRIVLIVDLWHPGLSVAEVSLLEGLYGYTQAYASRLSRYWSKNAATRRAGATP